MLYMMEKLPKVPSRSNSPVKSGRKGDHKVQFSDQSDLRLRGQKVCGKPPEVPRAPPYSRSSSRLSGSSSVSSSSSCSSNSRLSSGGGSSSALDRPCSRGGDSTKWTSSLDRKRSGSLRSKTSERQAKSDISRSHSLDRRRAESSRRESASPSHSSTERKRRDCEGKDSQNKEKKPKTKTTGISHSRSYSGERPRLPNRQKLTPPTLSQNWKNDLSKKETLIEQKVGLHDDDKTTSKSLGNIPMEWAERMKRSTSRSPQRSLNMGDGHVKEDKENEKKEKTKGEHKTSDKKERGRSLKRENRSSKSSSTKHKQ